MVFVVLAAGGLLGRWAAAIPVRQSSAATPAIPGVCWNLKIGIFLLIKRVFMQNYDDMTSLF
jgi:hypothetical protein